MTIKKNYTWIIALLLAAGLLAGLVFSFNTVKASNVEQAFDETNASLQQSYRMFSVAESSEPNTEIAFGSSPAAVSASCTLDTTNAVSYWPLDTNYNDAVGANHGSCTGTKCPTAVTGAASDGRFFIDTEEDIVDVPSTTDFDWANDVDFSVGLWVKTTQDCSGNKVFFGRYRNVAAGHGSWWLGCVPGGNARFHLRDSDSVVRRVTSSVAINDGEWHYIVGTRDATADENKIFVDGVESGMLNTPGYTGTFASDDVTTMGGYDESSLSTYYLSGVLDEVAVFNVALTASDITTYLGTCSFVPDVGDVAFATDENVGFDITGAELLANSTGGGLFINSIDATSEQGGTITGSDPYTYTPATDYSGTDFFSFMVEDGSANTAEGNAVITVNPVEAPDVTNPGDQTNDEGDVVSLQIEATDPQDQDMTYAATGLPPDLTINDTTGEITGTIAYTASPSSPYAVTVTVTDTDTNETSVDFNWTVNRVNQPPDVTDPGDQSDVEGDVISLQIVATDPNDDPLTYGATNLPDGLSISSSTGEISGTINSGASDFSPYNVTVSVDDGEAPAVEVTFDWTVARDNSPPDVTNPGDQTNTEGDNVSLQIVATDADGDSLVYAATDLPTGLSINTSTGEISGTIADGAGAFSPYNVTVTVDDGFATPVEVKFKWTVNSPMNYIYLPIVIRQD
jgi:hypothetical protein